MKTRFFSVFLSENLAIPNSFLKIFLLILIFFSYFLKLILIAFLNNLTYYFFLDRCLGLRCTKEEEEEA